MATVAYGGWSRIAAKGRYPCHEVLLALPLDTPFTIKELEVKPIGGQVGELEERDLIVRVGSGGPCNRRILWSATKRLKRWRLTHGI